jgi:hypothetical protein
LFQSVLRTFSTCFFKGFDFAFAFAFAFAFDFAAAGTFFSVQLSPLGPSLAWGPTWLLGYSFSLGWPSSLPWLQT